jgi:hypothetical protein
MRLSTEYGHASVNRVRRDMRLLTEYAEVYGSSLRARQSFYATSACCLKLLVYAVL